MQTAMQELIYYVKSVWGWDEEFELKANELLEKEKEQTIDFAYGCTQHISREDIETYYIKTFNNNKK